MNRQEDPMPNRIALESNSVAEALDRGDDEGARVGLYYEQGLILRNRSDLVELTLRTVANLIAVHAPATPEEAHTLVEKMIAAVCPD